MGRFPVIRTPNVGPVNLSEDNPQVPVAAGTDVTWNNLFLESYIKDPSMVLQIEYEIWFQGEWRTQSKCSHSSKHVHFPCSSSEATLQPPQSVISRISRHQLHRTGAVIITNEYCAYWAITPMRFRGRSGPWSVKQTAPRDSAAGRRNGCPRLNYRQATGQHSTDVACCFASEAGIVTPGRLRQQ